jgi:hypothetical protein
LKFLNVFFGGQVHITGLDENHKYCFRIKAVNAAGASEPSEPTDEIVCKLRKQVEAEPQF